MRKIDVSKITEVVRELCLKANFELREDVLRALKSAFSKETAERPKKIIGSIIDNARLARRERIAICQDTGIAVVYLDIGQDVALTGGSLKDAIDEGAEEAYREGYLRKSVVCGALKRENTNTNTPVIMHTDIVDGDRVRISVLPKGFGSENKSAVRMFAPTESVDKIKEFVIEVVKNACPDACPPLVLGIGIGGTFEKCADMAKKALLRPIDQRNPDRDIANLERSLIRDINSLGIGPMGLGGKTTVLGVNILEAHTHIAGLPVAVNVSCHATRSAERII
ncbi:MAG: fumarate hydratase [Candidatus Omnitrophota bacterium]|nr:fumarate hydratase [Candidatus Omnitrophota bacterium]